MAQLKYWDGTEWVNAIVGAAGPTGATGATGVSGIQGIQGTTGNDGIQGTTGTEGSQGIQGIQGVQGVDGTQGLTGSQGLTGTFGGATFDYMYESTLGTPTTLTPGYLQVNATGTSLYISIYDLNSANVSQFLETIDDSSSQIKGTFKLTAKFDQSKYAYFSIVGPHTLTAGDFYTVPTAFVSTSESGSPTSDTECYITFARTGDVGDQGIQGTQGIIGDDGFVAQTEPPTNTNLLWLDVDSGPSTPAQGVQGTQGLQGSIGTQGLNGSQGAQGTLGLQGTEGTEGIQGITGTQGTEGIQGLQGLTGIQGLDGIQGAQGLQGIQGLEGSQGLTGIQGFEGIQGTVGAQGTQGVQGVQGNTGTQGTQGITGASGSSSSYYEYKTDTTSQADSSPTNGYVRWNNAAQTSSTFIYISHLTQPGVDIDVLLGLISQFDQIIIQDRSNSNNYQTFTATGAAVVVSNSYIKVPVSNSASGGTGTTGFSNDFDISVIVSAVGVQGTTGSQGLQGSQGTLGLQGTNGTQGTTGLQGIVGSQGTAGIQGTFGTNGTQGTQGTIGIQGAIGLAPTDYVTTTGGSTITVASGATVPLTIQNNGTGNSFVVNDEAGDASPFTIASDGNVSIGTTTVPSGVSQLGLMLSTNVASGRNFILRKAAPSGNAPAYSFLKSSGTNELPTPVVSGDALGNLFWESYDGTNYVEAASILAYADNTVSTGAVPGRLIFNTNSLSGARIERMRINSSGGVSINTDLNNIRGSATGQFVTIAGSSAPGAVLELVNITADAAGNYSTIVFGASANTGLAVNKSIAQVEAYTSGTTVGNRGGSLIFSTKADNGSMVSRLLIDNTGLFTVTGSMSLSSTISASGLAGSLLTSTAGTNLGTAAAGTSTIPARADHVHSNTNVGVMTGTSFNSITGLSSTTPIIEGTAAIGTSTTVARADHVHPSGGGSTAGVALLSGATFTGQIQSTLANNTATGGGQIYLNGATGNRLDFNTSGVAAPTFTTRSLGTKIVLYPGVTPTSSDYAIGIDSGVLWQSIPDNTNSFRWYSGNTQIASLSGSGAFSAVTKSFDIEHPTKPDMRLRYGSLEGPENGVYVRGTTTTSIIELPDYWLGLVDENSITVNLTAVGMSQNIHVRKVEGNKVYIGGDLIKAFFTIYAERKDVDKLIVEY